MQQVETMTGISNSYICLLEKGKRDFPSNEVLTKLSKVYDVDYMDLMKSIGCRGLVGG